jgi:small-conductance mechanosensitive channel
MVFASLVDACGRDPAFVCEQVYRVTKNDVAAEVAGAVAGTPLRIALILLLAGLTRRLLRKVIDRFVQRLIRQRAATESSAEQEARGVFAKIQLKATRTVDQIHQRSERSKERALTLGAVMNGVATIAVATAATLLILGELQVNLGPLLAGAGVAGLAVGFGAQSLVRDVVAGIFVLTEDQYGVGDIVDLGDATGVVEHVSLRTTQLRDLNGALWTVPNGEVRRVCNKSQIWSRAVLDVEVAYATDVAHATSVIRRVIDDLWREELEDATIIEQPEIWGLERFGENALVIRVVLKTEPSEQYTTARIVRARLKQAFDEAGIEIPFPQRDVWIRNADESP